MSTHGNAAPSPPGGRRPLLAALACALAATLVVAGPARAQTDEIQVYDAAIAPPGIFNLTWHNNYTVEGHASPEFPGAIVARHSLNGVAEWAYGVTRWFEAGLYLPLYSRAGNGALSFDGFKLRALFAVPDAAQRRFFYGVNFEFSVNGPHWDRDRYTQEIRPIVGWHLGRLDLIFNPILDNSWHGFSQLDFAPATRVAWHVNERWTIAAEEYADFGTLQHFAAPSAQTHQLFAVFDYGGKPWSVEGGIGAGLTSAADRLVLKLIVARDLN